MERRSSVYRILECIFPAQDVIHCILEFDDPIRSVIERLQNELDHFIHVCRHFQRTAYRTTKFLNTRVRSDVLRWLTIEGLYQQPFRDFIDHHRKILEDLIQQTGYDVLGDRISSLPVIHSCLDYIKVFQADMHKTFPFTRTPAAAIMQ